MKYRIWELDAFRGICILGMIAVHLAYDLAAAGTAPMPALFVFLSDWGGILFILLSGICATLGRRSIRRGLTVLVCGFLVSAVTWAIYRLGFAGKDILIYFGILHCLGSCMLLWPLLKRLPLGVRGVLGIAAIAAGLYLETQALAEHPYGLPFGFTFPGFTTSDYFPLLPNLGYFLLGSVLGHTLYRRQETLLPQVDPGHPVIRFLCWCGRFSLPIYLLHQPVITGILYFLTLLA